MATTMTTKVTSRKLPRLVLHFDVNETILLGDVAGGDSFEDGINKCIAKNAIVNAKDVNHITWYDGTPLESTASMKSPPPLLSDWERPEHCTSYYEYYRKLLGDKRKQFTTLQHGKGYRKIYEQVEKTLRWPTEEPKPDPSDSILHEDGIHQFLLPSFFKTLSTLKQRGRSFSVVIRTYGDDMDELVACINAFSQGKHLSKYYYHDDDGTNDNNNKKKLNEFFITKDDVWKGRYDEKDGNFKLQNKFDEKKIISDENEALKMLQGNNKDNSISIVACQDDYHYWANNGYRPSFGKPLWITESDQNYHHIFFDDNIKNNPDDSIVAVRSRENENEPFKALDGTATLKLHGINLVKVPTYEAVLDEDWFLKQIEACEKQLLNTASRKQQAPGKF